MRKFVALVIIFCITFLQPSFGQIGSTLNKTGTTSAQFLKIAVGPRAVGMGGAFTAVADGQIYLSPNEQAKKAVLDALNGYDPTGEAIYYFNPATATNKWIWGRPQIKKIGKHIFCK